MPIALPLYPSTGFDSTPSSSNKKTKKGNKNNSGYNNNSYNNNSFDANDEAALHRRAARFQREHEIERQKQNGGPSVASANRQFAHLSLSRSNTPSSSAAWFGDEPEGDPVCLVSVIHQYPGRAEYGYATLDRMCLIGTNIPLWGRLRRSSKTISV